MSNGITIDALYEAFMDIDEFGVPTGKTPFAEDIFDFFGEEKLGDLGKVEWAKKYGSFFPTWDPSQVNLALRQRDLDYSNAMDTLNTTRDATERVYDTELDTLSTSLGKELSKGREIAGGIGIRSGNVESAIQDTIATTGSKAVDFGDRMRITTEDTKNKYNSAMVDSALDFEKTKRQEKEEFYNRTMAMIMKLMDKGAFDDPEDPCPGEVECDDGSCGGLNGCDCPEHADKPICSSVDPGIGDQPPGNEGIADAAYCTQICTPYVGMTSGGMTCYDSCLGTPTLGDGEFDPHIFNQMAQIEADEGCEYGAEWVGEQWVCAGGDDVYNPCAGVTGCAFNYASGNCQDVHGNACDCNCA